MKILVMNAGSSSLKYQLIDMENESVMAKGLCDRIGIGNSFVKHSKTGLDTVIIEKDIYNHRVAIEKVISLLVCKNLGVLNSMEEIKAVGHRVVHGGEKFSKSVIIDHAVMDALKDCIELAPLHNPANITGIEACQEIMKNTPMVAVFDTAFHQTMPEHAYMYAIPYDIYEKYSIRKYGFHGTSHKYVAEQAARMLKKPLKDTKLITCHLGNGVSMCAISGGKSIDTTMGFTPLAGLAMGTRSGNIDPAVVAFLIKNEKMTADEVNDYLNKRSGMLGLSGISSDFRDLKAKAEEGNKRASLAINIFCYRVKKYIGQYAAIMNGLDAIIFTAGIGENNDMVREKVTNGLDYMGIKIDPEKNKEKGIEIDISTEDAKVKTLVIPTNEELAIARATMKLTK